MNRLVCDHEIECIQELQQFPKTVKTEKGVYTVWSDLIHVAAINGGELLIEHDEELNWHYE